VGAEIIAAEHDVDSAFERVRALSGKVLNDRAVPGVIQPVQDALPDENTYTAPDPFGPVNDGSIPLEVPATESGYVSPYSQQSSEGINRQRTDGSGEPAGDRAGFWPRLFAFLIDAVAATVCWAVLLFVVGLFTDRLNEPFFFSVKLRTVLIYIAQKIYFVISEWRFQKTLGKKALRLKLISSESFEGPDLWTVVFRETFGKFISSVCIVGDLMILGKEHLPLYDRLADTEVVYTVNVSKTIKEEIKADPAQIPSVPAPVQEQDTGSV
ncbi:MAG: RDD family protein, partial [Oscillospiraceae bacterium]|nr:RDD family protein [Oscillospiraceae bacterium]